ncbi:hypothetical protein M408DRAFT_328385 [Serendipita vermifera MAFF 305830]|uniref:Uncharacterized protein n=1 Tax=Serendipita vermifera MAFF 305830 TaxID=933852 RepID=A0A0C3AZF9_SERVB|nr:hypothetical protein M408DRAFT_328385 [Serendipita vermifera MAFF 305830]
MVKREIKLQERAAIRGGGSGGGRGSSGGSSSSGSSTRGGPGTTRGSLGGSGNTGRSSISSSSWGSSTSTLGKADYFSRGGGSPFTIGSGAFAGRQAGGGTRDQVLGTRRFGSGYPYSNGNIQRGGVYGQPFPFGFWPIFFVGHGYSGEYRGYGRNDTEQRPGGDLVEVAITPKASDWTLTPEQTANNSAAETFYMIGDRESVETMLIILSPCPDCEEYSCGANNSSITAFNSSTSQILFENTIQWYRSSSFSLAYLGYNNTYAFLPLNESSTLDWDNSTPLSDALQTDTFLQCINNTLTAALPVLNAGCGRFLHGKLNWMVVWAIWIAVLILNTGNVTL